MLAKRALLLRLIRYFFAALLCAVIFVLIDFAIDMRPATVQTSYRFIIREIQLDQPVWLREDNLTVILIHRSKQVNEALNLRTEHLQNLSSDLSNQPEYAKNTLRSKYPEYFVSYANGTDLGCIVELKSEGLLGEICGDAQYDFAGRALISKKSFQNLSIPDYNFSDNFNTLIIRP